LKEDVARWNRAGRRFAALFLPQLGHGPWHDFTDSGIDDLTARGRKIIATQDAWLGEILDQLERAGRLEKTLILLLRAHRGPPPPGPAWWTGTPSTPPAWCPRPRPGAAALPSATSRRTWTSRRRCWTCWGSRRGGRRSRARRSGTSAWRAATPTSLPTTCSG